MEMSELLAAAIVCAECHIECSVLLVNAVEALACGVPQRIAHLYVRGGELLVLSVLHAPHIACDAARVVFAPCILISLYIIIYNRAVFAHAQIVHRQGRIEGLTATGDAYTVHLLVCSARENNL